MQQAGIQGGRLAATALLLPTHADDQAGNNLQELQLGRACQGSMSHGPTDQSGRSNHTGRPLLSIGTAFITSPEEAASPLLSINSTSWGSLINSTDNEEGASTHDTLKNSSS
jgi:hypothetical protein